MSNSQTYTLNDLKVHGSAASSKLKDGVLAITAPPEVDWWRAPEPVKVNRRDGPFFRVEIDGSRSFECEVWLRSSLVGLYDQACLVVHGGDLQDEWAHWLKTGTETFEERQWINAVVSTPFCDVSTVLSQRELAKDKDGDWVYLKLVKQLSITGHTILIQQAQLDKPDVNDPPGPQELANLREVQAFGVRDNGIRSDDKKWSIGVMVSGLENPKGAFGEFTGFQFIYTDGN